MQAAGSRLRYEIYSDDDRAREMNALAQRAVVRDIETGITESAPITELLAQWEALDQSTVDVLRENLWPFLTASEVHLADTVEFITLPSDDFNAFISKESGRTVIALNLAFRVYFFRFLQLTYDAYDLRDRQDVEGLIPVMFECWALADEICRGSRSTLMAAADGARVQFGPRPVTDERGLGAIQSAESLGIVFVVAHELAHLFRGDLGSARAVQGYVGDRLLFEWELEFGADELATEMLLRGAMTSGQLDFALSQLFAIMLLVERTRDFVCRIEGSEPPPRSHPPASERFERLASRIHSDGSWFQSTVSLYKWGIFSLQEQVLAQSRLKCQQHHGG
jgi:hypothetical protein